MAQENQRKRRGEREVSFEERNDREDFRITDAKQIKTKGDFRQYVLFLVKGEAEASSRSLEAYLQALWGLVRQVQTQEVTCALLGQLLSAAFQAEPLPFDESWLRYDTPPDLDEQRDPFSLLQHMICYQITDLHLMAQANLLENELRWFGIESPRSRHTWYNFEPSAYLECACQTIRKDNTSIDADWLTLAILLWLGQIYE